VGESVPDREVSEWIVFAYENESRKAPIEYIVNVILSTYGVNYKVCSYADLEACSNIGVLISYGVSLPRYRTAKIPHVHIAESDFWGDAYLTEESLPPLPLREFQGVPVLYWGNNTPREQFTENKETSVIPADIIASSFFMLSRYEEVVINEKDRFGRFPAQASISYKAGILQRPVVNEYIDLLWNAISAVQKSIVREHPWKEKGFAFCLTHDIDRVKLYDSPKHILGILWRAGIKRGNVRSGLQAIRDAFGTWLKLRADPYDTFDQLIALEAEFDVKATYFFMAGGDTAYDKRYHIEQLSEILQRLIAAGHEVGLHASFNSYHDPASLKTEKKRLEDVLSQPTFGSRQHYLRWETPATWIALAKAGVDYDATLGYAQYEGFRAGTCYPFHPYDILHDKEMPLWEVPLIVMDSTLLEYRGLQSEVAKEAIMEMVAQVKRYRGVFTLLWHNSSLYDLVHPGVSAVFRDIIKEICAEDPLRRTISETVKRWEKFAKQPR